MIGKIKRFIPDTVTNRIILSFVFLVIIPISIVSYLTNYKTEKKIEEKISLSLNSVLAVTENSIGSIFKDMMNTNLSVAANSEVIEILEGTGDYDLFDKKKFLDTFSRISNLFLGRVESNAVLFDLNGNQYSSATGIRENVTLSDYSWYNEASNRNNSFFWFHNELKDVGYDNNNLISVAMPVFSGNDYVGLCIISVNESDIYKILQNSVQNTENNIFIIDRKGKIVSHKDKQLLGSDISDQEYIQHILKNGKGYLVDTINSEKSIVFFSPVRFADWTIVQVVPYKEFFDEVETIKWFNLMINGMCLLIFILITVTITKSVTRPLKNLQKKMKGFREYNQEQYITEVGPEEIVVLIYTYNKMLDKIGELIANIETEHRQKEDMRFKALQAQIKPHFLFNTLNNIKMMALMNGDHEVGRMISALGNIMEGSIGRGNDVIKIKEELEYLRSYMKLQEVRYNHRINLETEIPEDIQNQHIIKFTLQPIVENSIYHGFGKSGGGNIKIFSLLEAGSIKLAVQDNGQGISPEKVYELKQMLNSGNIRINERVGLKNIHDRIKLNFGQEYGLDIESVVDKGTVVWITIPYKKDQGEN